MDERLKDEADLWLESPEGRKTVALALERERLKALLGEGKKADMSGELR